MANFVGGGETEVDFCDGGSLWLLPGEVEEAFCLPFALVAMLTIPLVPGAILPTEEEGSAEAGSVGGFLAEAGIGTAAGGGAR